MNKLIPLLLCLGFGVHHASARTRPVAGGISPDKTMEIVVSSPTAPAGLCEDFPEQYHYSLVLRQVRTGKVLFESLNQWQTSFFAVGARPSPTSALWSADSRFVVLSFEGAIHTKILRLFSVRGRTAAEMSVPDYAQPVRAALGMEDVKSLVAEPRRWHEHTLELVLSGTTPEPRESTGSYDFDFSATLKIQPQGHTIKAALSTLQDKSSTPQA